MYKFGGGYTDIKFCSNSWEVCFDMLNNDIGKFALGVPASDPEEVAYLNDYIDGYSKSYINDALMVNYSKVLNQSCFIFKPQSRMAGIWLEELHRRLDIEYDNLKNNPGNIWGDNEGYPIAWNTIMGQIFVPLTFVYRKSIIFSNIIEPSFENYR